MVTLRTSPPMQNSIPSWIVRTVKEYIKNANHFKAHPNKHKTSETQIQAESKLMGNDLMHSKKEKEISIQPQSNPTYMKQMCQCMTKKDKTNRKGYTWHPIMPKRSTLMCPSNH